MAINIKVNGRDIKFPTHPDELTLGQFMDLRSAATPIEEFCALTGFEKETVENFKSMETLKKASALMMVLANEINKGDFARRKMPDKVWLAGQMIKVPKDLTLEPIGAWMNVHNLLAEKHNRNEKMNLGIDFTDCIPETLQHYFYIHCNKGRVYNEINVEAPDWVNEVLKIPLTAAVPIANFFSQVSELAVQQSERLDFYQIGIRTGKKRQPTEEEIRAGVRAFSEFGHVGTINRLANGDVTKWQEAMSLPWEYAITRLEMMNMQAEYDENLFNIRNPKTKENGNKG